MSFVPFVDLYCSFKLYFLGFWHLNHLIVLTCGWHCLVFTSSAVSSGEVSALDHELLDDSVELAALVTESFLFNRSKRQRKQRSKCLELHQLQVCPKSWTKSTNLMVFQSLEYQSWQFHKSRRQTTTSLHIAHLSCCQGDKVVDGFGNSFAKDADDDSSHIFVSDSDVKVNLERGRPNLTFRWIRHDTPTLRLYWWADMTEQRFSKRFGSGPIDSFQSTTDADVKVFHTRSLNTILRCCGRPEVRWKSLFRWQLQVVNLNWHSCKEWQYKKGIARKPTCSLARDTRALFPLTGTKWSMW